jgi:uncharacterized protein (DUF1800 family)
MSQTALAAIAAHRFGLGEADLAAVGDDAQRWLLAQIGAADPQRGDALPTAAEGLRRHDAYLRRLQARNSAATMAADSRTVEQQFADHFRDLVQADLSARLVTAATTQRPFAERLALFWANHFTVSLAKGATRGLVGAFEREAIRPHIAGPFEQLLGAATQHAAMLRYLDNALSAGPHSRVVARLARRNSDDGVVPRITGLNENLAREVLELHTLGVDGGYTQADVTAFAAVLTGWRAPRLPRGEEASFFDAAWHEPGSKTVLGKTYREGSQALHEVLHDLVQHPATARFIATKLARHFVADEPPSALVDRLARSFRDSAGHLPTVYAELVRAPEAWQPQAVKLKTPEEFVVSSARLLRTDAIVARGREGGIALMGQRVQGAPSPAGWPDRAEEWLGPDAVWKRLEWATRVGDRLGRQVDARALANQSLGPLLSDNSRRQIERAADGSQALTLLLMAPEFQRR